MSLNRTIYEQLQALAKAALGPDVPVILGRQGKPAPNVRHLVIMPIPEIGVHGQGDDRWNGTAFEKHIDWVGEVDVRELDGDGDYLRLLLEATDWENVKDYLTEVSFLSATTIQDLSFQEGSEWVLEARVGLRISVKTKLAATTDYIEKIGIHGVIGPLEITADIPA